MEGFYFEVTNLHRKQDDIDFLKEFKNYGSNTYGTGDFIDTIQIIMKAGQKNLKLIHTCLKNRHLSRPSRWLFDKLILL